MRYDLPVPSILVALLMTGCPSDDVVATDSDTDAFVCDPVGDLPIQNGLANAPLADDVQVIIKTPQHPGDPGPNGLP